MQLRTLRAFVAVVQEGGFSPAAKAVAATQSTVSKAVKNLEDELGLTLLERTGQRSDLTAAGDIVYRRALTMLAERDDLLAELAELRGLRRGTLRLGIAPMGAALVYASLFAKFRAAYPAIDLVLVERGAKHIEDLLRAGDLDLGISLLPTAPGFEHQLIMSDRLLAMLPIDSPYGSATGVRLEDLSDTPFVLFDDGFQLNDVVLAGCARAGFNPTVAVRSSQVDFIAELVSVGMGVGFIPNVLAAFCRHAAVSYCEIEDANVDWRLGFVWRRSGYLSHAAQAWLALARETPVIEGRLPRRGAGSPAPRAPETPNFSGP